MTNNKTNLRKLKKNLIGKDYLLEDGSIVTVNEVAISDDNVPFVKMTDGKGNTYNLAISILLSEMKVA